MNFLEGSHFLKRFVYKSDNKFLFCTSVSLDEETELKLHKNGFVYIYSFIFETFLAKKEAVLFQCKICKTQILGKCHANRQEAVPVAI